MVTPQFKEYYEKLNPEQREAVDTIEGPVMVVAGPGTGKTQILTLRIANILINSQVNPENILALTFTESGVLAMRKRLVEIIGTDGYRVNITTFHGFCNEVIRGNPENFPHLISSEPITDLEQIQILEEIIKKADVSPKILTSGLSTDRPQDDEGVVNLSFLKPFGDPLYHIRSILSAINDLKKEGVSPERFKELVEEELEDFKNIDDLYYESGIHQGKMKGKYQSIEKDIQKNLELFVVYKEYQEKLREKKFYDYNDMIMQVVEVLEKDKELLLRLQERYQYILVDEHQDTNSSQNKIIELLGSFFEESPNIFVVGDEKQAIFRFQGASLENFLYFKKLYPTAKLINLTFNYRSNQTVLDASGSLIKNNPLPEGTFLQRLELKAQAGIKSERIKIVSFGNYFDEYQFLADDIKKKIDKGTLPQEIAVIYRNNKDVFSIASAFEQKGVPFFIESDQDILSDIDVKKLIFIFYAIENFGEDYHLIPILHFDFLNLTPLDIYKVIKFSRKSEKGIYEILSDEKNLKPLELENKDGLLDLYKNLERWCELSKNDCVENLFITVLQESGLLKKVLGKKDVLERLEKFSTLFQETKRQSGKREDFSLKDFLDYIDLIKAHQILIKRIPRGNLIKAVRLMTAHKSKGLEFEYVYITQAFDGHWGSKKSRQYFKLPIGSLVQSSEFPPEARLAKGGKVQSLQEGDSNSDERRLFYVAMTRAKKGITITYSKASLEGKEQLPALFIEEIEEKYKEYIEGEKKEDAGGVEVFPEVGVIDSGMMRVFALKKESGVGIKDKEFFQFLFDSEGLSVTGFNNFLKCPWRYFYSNLIQIPFLMEKQQVFGIAIHSAICKYISLKLSGKKQLDLLIKKFEEVLKGYTLSKQDKEELVVKGEDVLTGYFDNVLKNLNGDYFCEFEVKNVTLKNTIKINGRIDKIEKIKGSGEVVIYDLKTGKPKTRGVIEGTAVSSKISGDYLRQLNFYKLLLDRYDNGRYKAGKGVIEFIEPDDKGRYKTEEFIYDGKLLKELEEEIIRVSEEIRNLDFWEKRCGEQDCRYCSLRELMD